MRAIKTGALGALCCMMLAFGSASNAQAEGVTVSDADSAVGPGPGWTRADAPLAVVAKIGNKEYTDLPTAFSEVGDGETITMVATVSNLNVTAETYMALAAGKKVTFDLAGYTVYGENSIKAMTVMLLVEGDLTIEDSSEGKTGRFGVKPLCPAGYDEGDASAYGNYLFFVKGGSVTVNGGTLENEGSGALCYVFEMGEWGYGGTVVVNDGTVRARTASARMYSFQVSPMLSFTVNGGLVDSSQGRRAAILYFAPDDKCGRGAIAITGGTVRAVQYTVYAYGTGGGLTIDMTGGTVEATEAEKPAFAIYNANAMTFPDEQTTLNISGGTVSGYYALNVWDYNAATHTTISGGNFTGRFFVRTFDPEDPSYDPRTDDYCVRITGGNFTDFNVSGGSKFLDDSKSGVLLYGGTYDKALPLTDAVRHKGRVAEGHIYFDNFNDTWTVVRGCIVEGVPCAKLDDTTIVEAAKPAGTTEEAWATATNIVATATTTDAPDIVANSELTNTVRQAREDYGETSVLKIWSKVNVAVTPKEVEALGDEVYTIKMDVTPSLTTWAEVSDGETLATNLVGGASREFDYSGEYMEISFDVAGMASEPIRVIHRHADGSAERYTRGDVASATTFAYDPEAEKITLLMRSFSDVEIHAAVQVGDTAYATINKTGVCSVAGTGDMWSYAKPTDSKLWEYRDVVGSVVIGDTMTSVGANAFAYQKRIRDVAIGAGVTNVCEDAFFSCLNVTNLAVGAGVKTVGASAFGRCNSLTDLSFGSKEVAEACQGKAFKIVARITMNGKTPVIDAVPKVTITGYTRTLKGCENLGGEWTAIADEANIPENCHFFKYEYDEEK